MEPTYRNVSSYKDRHGKTRWRFRRRGNNICLPGSPGDIEFDSRYNEIVSNKPPKVKVDKKIELQRRSVVYGLLPSITRAKFRAKSKNVPFCIDESIVERKLIEQDWRCAVSGILFNFRNLRNTEEKPFRPSIDRIIPSKGYVEDNIRIVCEIVNLAMNQWGEAPLLKLVSAIVDRRIQDAARSVVVPD